VHQKQKDLLRINGDYGHMKQETVNIPKKEYEELLEEVGILRDHKMMEAVKESDEAKEKNVKAWELKI
jgi:PHD/YefM family antitoxin component YafN of YafNO toxin-antitoxin module